jgi:hypothetical protein
MPGRRRLGRPRATELRSVVTFFQKGAGRKEEALVRGLGKLAEPDKILRLLVRENIITRFRGEEGWVFAPQRAQAGRMRKMLEELNTSTDPIWTEVAAL